MNYTTLAFSFFFILAGTCCTQKTANNEIYTSDDLKVYQISDQTYVHRAYLQTESYGKVGCNGLIYVNKGEAIIFDTPPDTIATQALLAYISDQLKAKVIAVVPTHFHEDCLGGLGVVHPMGIVSIANQLTVELGADNEETAPLMGFDSAFALPVGGQEVWMGHLGEGHTRDNIIGYIPSSKIIFGGCLIKSVGASKGYTGDANLDEWSNTVRNVKVRFPEAKIIVPGHGQWGDQELLDYTIQLFDK